METTQEKCDRIFAAANMLYEQAGRKSFPAVQTVRKAAKVGMNDTSLAMKEWRRLQVGELEEPVGEEGAACAEQAEMQKRPTGIGVDTEELRAELDRTREERDKAQGAAAASTKWAESLLAELTEANIRATELGTEITIREASWAESVEDMDRQIKVARKDARDAQTELRAAVKEARDAAWRLGHAQGELNRLLAEVDSLHETIRQMAAQGTDGQPLVARLWAWVKQCLGQAR
ncbi:MAG: hypothetical protein FWG52_05765 [Proteobacteria bacterium]|nr:hypothetical protein [Pseudomonadota bacterium]